MGEITVLIVDDHAIVREGLKRILNESKIKVVGEAANGQEGIEKTLELQPDVVLMDIEMPQLSGIEATRIIKRQNPLAHVVILTIHEEEEMLFEAVKAGALGYVSKDRAPEELLEVIENASQGLSLLRPTMASKILNEFSRITFAISSPNFTLTTEPPLQSLPCARDWPNSPSGLFKINRMEHIH